jgi:class 3 adenylate cyclase
MAGGSEAGAAVPPIVTLLFTDLVGSTALYDDLGDVEAERVRRTHFASLREAVTDAGGREVKNVGDGLMVVFASAVAAVEAAVAMQQSVARRNRTSTGAAVGVRIGIHVGEPLQDDDDFFGLSVNIAKRLCDAAASGQILVSDVVRALVSLRGTHAFTPVGALALKGIAEPLPSFEVPWTAPELDRLPLPHALAPRRAELPLVGRESPMAALRKAWEEATAAGDRRLLLLAGEPGIGKTRLATEFARAVHGDRAAVLFGRCDDEPLAAYQPFAEALRTVVAGPLGARLIEGLGPAARALGPLLPEIESETPPDRSFLFSAVDRCLGILAADQPVLLLLDDLHWADAATIAMLRSVLRGGSGGPVLVVGTYRDTDLDRRHPLAAALGDLRRDAVVERTALRGLDESAVAELLASRNPGVDRIARSIAEDTAGNPLFVGELIRHLQERGELARVDGSWAVLGDAASLPEGVRDVIARRLTRLDDDANRVLAVAAVLGRRFALPSLAGTADMALDDVLDAVEEALAARLLEPVVGSVDTFQFTHALVRAVLYDEISTSRRLRLHAAAGTVLAAAGTDAAEVAYHLLEAGPAGDVVQAAAWASAAATAQHRIAFSHETAIGLCDRALEALAGGGPGWLRADLLTTKANAHLAITDNEPGAAAGEAAIAAARLDGDLARWTAAVAVAARSLPDLPARHVEEAIEAVGTTNPALRGRLLGVLTFHMPLGPRRHALVDEAWAIGTATDDVETLMYASLNRALAMAAEPRAEEILAMLDDIEPRALVVEGFARLPFLMHRIPALMELCERDLVERETAAYADASDRLGGGQWSVHAMVLEAVLDLLDGRLAAADEKAQVAAAHPFAGPAMAGGLLVTSAREQGNGAGLIPFLASLAESAAVTPAYRAALALLRADAGDHDGALVAADGVAAMLVGEPERPVGLAVLAEVAHHTGSQELAAEIYAQLLPWSGRAAVAGQSLCVGAADRYLALAAATVGRAAEAERHFALAHEANARLRSALYGAHTSAEHASFLRDTDPARAAELAAEARTAADRLDLVLLRRRLDAAGW